jgi:hypothetical protein
MKATCLLQLRVPAKPFSSHARKKTEGERAVMEARTGGILILEDNCIRVDRETSTNASYLLI